MARQHHRVVDEPEGRGVAADLVALVEDPAHLLHELLERGVCEQAVGEAGGSPDGHLGPAADEHRDLRRGPGANGERRQPVDVALVRERLP